MLKYSKKSMVNKLSVAIRTDSSAKIGSGHVMRCLTLADQLRACGADAFFICCDLPGNLSNLIQKRGYNVFQFQLATADNELSWQYDAEQTIHILSMQGNRPTWLVVDHYDLDIKWESQLKNYVTNVLVIDDLANRSHDCDVLLDQTFGQESDRYIKLIPSHCLGLYGTRYALLRPEFEQVRHSCGLRSIQSEQSVVHVFFGGVDPNNFTSKFGHLLLKEFGNLKLRVLVGAGFRGVQQLIQLKEVFGDRISWDQAVENVALHMANCTVAFGAPGTATWERACLGMPSAYLSVDSHQTGILELLSSKGFCSYLGSADQITYNELVSRFGSFLDNKPQLLRMRETCLANVDGKGTKRVVEIMKSLNRG